MNMTLKTQAIEAVLLRRQHSAWRNWRPGMTVRELLNAEPFLHFSWTAPRTWVLGETLTAALLNTHLRDNLNATGVATAAAQGDIVYATAANALARLAKGAAYKLLQMNSGATAPQWGNPFLITSTTDVAINNTVTETTIITQSIAGNLLGTANFIIGFMWIDLAVTSSETFTYRLKYGATTLATSVNASSTAAGHFGISFWLKADAATNAQRGGIVIPNIVSSTFANNWPPATGTSAIDSTSAQTFLISGQHSVANAGNTFSMRSYAIQLVS